MADQVRERVETVVDTLVRACDQGQVRSVVVYGSAATGDAMVGFSDIDLHVIVDRPFTLKDALALHEAFKDLDLSPFEYVQPTFSTSVLDAARLPPGSFRAVYGELPANLELSPQELKERSASYLASLPLTFRREVLDWAVATPATIHRRARLLLTTVKPALRAFFTQNAPDPVPVWNTKWDDLVELARLHSDEFGSAAEELIRSVRLREDAAVARSAIAVLALVVPGGSDLSLI